MNFTIRPFEPTDLEYAAAVEIYNQAWPDDPSTVEAWKEDDKSRNPDDLNLRFIGEVQQGNAKQIVAVGFVSGLSRRPGEYTIDFDIDPEFEGQALDEILCTHLIAALDDKNPAKLKCWIQEGKERRIELLQQKGFQQGLRNLISELDVSSFELAAFAGYSEKVESSGIAIVNLQELQERNSDWMQKLYDLEMTIAKDVRYADEFKPMGLKNYAKYFEHVNFRTDASFVALDGDDYVGSCSLVTEKVIEDSKISQGFSGVLPSHRRRGIGTALKLRTIEFAKAQGANTIETSNEESNPMYALNIKLGFKPTPAWLHFEKFL